MLAPRRQASPKYRKPQSLATRRGCTHESLVVAVFPRAIKYRELAMRIMKYRELFVSSTCGYLRDLRKIFDHDNELVFRYSDIRIEHDVTRRDERG